MNSNVFLRKNIALILGLMFLMSSNLSAHEMWIEPIHYELKLQEKILAHEKVGQNFKGNEYSYLSSSYKSLKLTVNGKTRDVKSRIGDIPAINEVATEEGLTILWAETTHSDISYKTWKKFEDFIKSKGLDWVLDEHKKRGLPAKNFIEAFSRYPKSLIKVGDGKGSDQKVGMPIEWVAETNPYTDSDDGVRLHLYWQGKPFVNTHVSVFNRLKNELIVTDLKTDDKGMVIISRAKGGQFLINAVQMIEPSESVKTQTGAVWESLWASLTYELPPLND